MNKISMAILEHERDRIKNQISVLNRKITLFERFMSDFPDVETEKAQAFVAFVDHTNLAYEEILDTMGR